MTYSAFFSLCYEKTIEPAIALDNEAIREALRAKDDKLVVQLLDSEF